MNHANFENVKISKICAKSWFAVDRGCKEKTFSCRFNFL